MNRPAKRMRMCVPLNQARHWSASCNAGIGLRALRPIFVNSLVSGPLHQWTPSEAEPDEALCVDEVANAHAFRAQCISYRRHERAHLLISLTQRDARWPHEAGCVELVPRLKSPGAITARALHVREDVQIRTASLDGFSWGRSCICPANTVMVTSNGSHIVRLLKRRWTTPASTPPALRCSAAGHRPPRTTLSDTCPRTRAAVPTPPPSPSLR
jgi:hypothetical protein